MKKFHSLTVIVVFFLLAFVGAFLWWTNAVKPVSDATTLKRIVVERGSSGEEIADKLRAEGIIRSPLTFKFYVQLTGKSDKLQSGEFNLPQNLNLYQVIDRLARPPDEIWVTIPEGLRREEIAEKFINSLELQGADAKSFRTRFLIASADLEGFLFPDTYLFPREVAPETAVQRLKDTFDARIAEFENELPRLEINTGLNLNEVVTLASLLERETKTDEERPVVAGILLKRLEAGWPLQVDAAVQYAVANSKLKTKNSQLENYWEILTKDDLEINSPFNTYKFAGLPPMPIASPGLSSLAGVINAKESEYWFYIHDTEGKIHYAATIDEHNENIQRYLK